MKNILLIGLSLLLIVGCSEVEGQQNIIPVVEIYKNGDIETITYHKKSRSGIERFKSEKYRKSGEMEGETIWEDKSLKRKTFYFKDSLCRSTIQEGESI